MTMLQLAVRGVRASLGRLILTTVAVVAGVGFVAGSFILADSLGDTIDALLESDVDTPDAQIQLTELEFGRDDRAIPDTVVAEVAALPEVDKAEPLVFSEEFEKFAVLDDAGTEIKPGFGRFVLTNQWDGEENEDFTIVDGNAPVGLGQVALDAGYAEAADLAVGDEVTIATTVGQRRFEVAAIVAITNLAGNYALVFDFPTAQVLYDKEGQVDSVSLTRATGVSTEEMMAAVEATLPEQAMVRSFEELIADASAEIEKSLAIVRNVLLGFAGVALFVSLFIIYNTFAILVTQRLQQIGLLRAVGATRGQIRLGVIFEALLVGVVGGLIGLGVGYAIAFGLQAVIESTSGFDTSTVVTPRTVIVALVVAVVATTVSALVPSFLAGRVSPVAAMRNELPSQSSATRRVMAGGGVLAMGLLVLAVGLFGGGQSTSALVAELAIGSLLTFVGVALLSVLFAGPFVDFAGRPPVLGGGLTALGVSLPVLVFTVGDGARGIAFLPKMAVSALAIVVGISILATWLRGGRRTGVGGSAGGLAGQLARQNAARSPRRTAATATALTIGIALVSAFGVVGESLKSAQSDIISRSVQADLFVTSDKTMSSEVADRLESTRGVAEVSRVRYNEIRIGDDIEKVAAYEADTGDRLISLAVSAGSVDGVLDGGVLVFADTAEDRSIGIGDTVTVEFPDNETEQLVVAGIFDDNALEREWIVDLGVYERHVSSTDDDLVAVSFAPGADADALTAEVEAVANDVGSYKVLNAAEITEELEGELKLIVTIINSLLSLTLFVAFLGVINTIVLSVIERTREVGLLRAVGMTRRQVKATIRWESVMVCLFGAALGIGLGVLFAWAAVSVIPDEFIANVVVPYESVLFTVLVAVLAGVLAAVIPARRAARLDVLDAISTAG
jgi:putative ABC transport system permease protein